MIVRSAQEEFPVDKDGSSLKRRFLVELLVVRQRPGSKRPRHLKLTNVAAVNLRRPRIARAAWIVGISRPARVGPRLGARGTHQPHRQHKHQEPAKSAKRSKGV